MKLRWALLLVALVALAWAAAGVHASRDTELDVSDADADADADDALDVDADAEGDAAPAPAAAGAVKAKAKGKGKGKAAKAKGKAKKKPFDDFGLARAAAFKLPKRAIRVRGNARTHRLKVRKLLVRSRLPFTDAKAQRSAGVCKAGKCKLKRRAKRNSRNAKAKGKGKGNGKHQGKGKGQGQGKGKAKTAAEAFPKSALPPVPFTAEELKAAAKRAAKGHAFVQLTDGADAEADADADADTDAALAAADADADSGADDAAAEEEDDEEDAAEEADAADAEAEEGDAFVESGAVAARKGRSGKGKGKRKGKAKKAKSKKQRVPVLVSRPSALVRRRVKAKRVKTLRGYARHVHAKGARVHVITPHRRTTTKLVTTGKGKHRKQRLVTVVSKRKRKIELTALLEVTGNVLFGKRGDELKDKHKHKQHKGKGKGKGKPHAKHSATGTAFIENLMVLSKRVPSSAAAAAAAAEDDGSDPHAHGHAHSHQHQWRLVYDDVNSGWSGAAAACTTLRHKWAASPMPAVVPPQSFAGAGADTAAASSAAAVQQTLTDLPEHSLIAVSGTFHFLGAWRGEVGFATVNGAHVWLDTFAAAVGDDIDASLPQQQSVPFRVVLPHTAHDVTIGFGSSLPADADGRVACWAFDDVAVSVMH